MTVFFNSPTLNKTATQLIAWSVRVLTFNCLIPTVLCHIDAVAQQHTNTHKHAQAHPELNQ